MEFKKCFNADECCLKVYPDVYKNNMSDGAISYNLGMIEYDIARHVDGIQKIVTEDKYLYYLEDDNKHESLFDALMHHVNNDIYGYYRFEYLYGVDNNKRSEYAENFQELCEYAYIHGLNGFKMCETGTDKLTEDQSEFIRKIIEFRKKEI